ncbi:CLUMA_CG019387, isoform A [Clunio marinus]|uniref:CLUMA_CG019387, isoform A n=1 Tax=Clunio marinus TaxID=568069 RepID=A0A1J1J182_9DIPT|nr:CLUMA_CG019387, isoform A [Clunio marinus]
MFNETIINQIYEKRKSFGFSFIRESYNALVVATRVEFPLNIPMVNNRKKLRLHEVEQKKKHHAHR